MEKVTVEDLFRQFEENPPSDMAPCLQLWEIFNFFLLQTSVAKNLISLKELALAGDGTPVYTSAQERKTRTCDCLEKGIWDCKCNRIYHQPDCDIGWDSHRNRFYCGYDLYMLTASDSENGLPVFPFLSPASRHDSHGFLLKITQKKSGTFLRPSSLCTSKISLPDKVFAVRQDILGDYSSLIVAVIAMLRMCFAGE